jgi:hypothetical protein
MRKIILTIAVGALLAGAVGAAAAASVNREDTVLYKIGKAVAAGELDRDTALMYRYFALTPAGMEYVPAKYRAEWYSAEPVDGTPVWLELRDRWADMSPGPKQKIMEVWGADPFTAGMSDGGVRFRNLPGFLVYSNYGGYPVFHYDSPDSIGGNFRVHWVEQGPHKILDKTDSNNNGVPDMVEYYAEDAERAWKVYADHEWFYHPNPEDQKYLPLKDYYPDIPYPPDEEWDYGGNDKWDMYLGAFTQGVLGMTTRDPFEFAETYRDDGTPYFMERSKYDPPTGQYPECVTVAHELNHGVQYMLDVAESSASATPRWYFEATAVWAQNEVYPGEAGAIGRVNGFLGSPLQSLDNPGDGADGGYQSAIWNFFLNDWSRRYWKAPDWTPVSSPWPGATVRDVWRALSKGDEWYTNDPTVNRESKEAVGFLVELHDLKTEYLQGRTFKDTFELWTTWNWLTGARDDGKHYELGSRYITVTPQNTWGPTDYPLVKYKPTEAYYMNHLGHGFYRFDNPPNWPAVLIYYEGDEDNDPASKDWGGAVYVTKNGSTWTNLSGTAGEATPMFTPDDKGIIQIRNPGQYQTIVAIFSCVSDVGEDLPFEYSFVSTDDMRAPAVGAGVAVLQSNPDYIELLVGTDEELFGKPEAEIYFTSDGGAKRAELVEMNGPSGGKNFSGTFVLDVGDTGNGHMKWKLSDKAGNFVSGRKNFSAGFLASSGGAIGDGKASLRVSSGTVGKATLFLITPRAGYEESEVAVAASLPDGEGRAVETVGPAYDYAPNWARLAKPAEVMLSYEGLTVNREDYLSVYRWNGSSWEDLGGTIDKRARRVVATADRLGTFVLGYGEKKGSTPPSGKPKAFGLYQSYPNPARDGAVITYALPASSEVKLTVYDLSGRRVATLVNQVKDPGVYQEKYRLVDDSGRPLPAGVYLYRLEAGADVATKKMVVAR